MSKHAEITSKNGHKIADRFIFKTNATMGRSKEYFTELLSAEIHKSKLQPPRQLSHLEKNAILKRFKRQSEYGGITKAPGVSNLATKLPRTRGKQEINFFLGLFGQLEFELIFQTLKNANFNNKSTKMYLIYTEAF